MPDNEEELLNLPGVGRKTANCVLVYAFQKSAIPVDTHVHRISNRLGLVDTKIPAETEKECQQIGGQEGLDQAKFCICEIRSKYLLTFKTQMRLLQLEKNLQIL